MIRVTGKGKLQAALADDRIHGREWAAQMVQNRALFDVKLKVTQTIPSQGGPWNFHWPQSKLFDRFFDGNAIRVAAAQKLRIQAAHQGATADKRRTKPDSFLFRESDNLDPEGKPSSFERLKQRDRKDYSKNAIVRSRIGNRVEVRSQEQSRSCPLDTRIVSAQISCGIETYFSSHPVQPFGNLRVAIAHGR
jgi:hypothetical protein